MNEIMPNHYREKILQLIHSDMTICKLDRDNVKDGFRKLLREVETYRKADSICPLVTVDSCPICQAGLKFGTHRKVIKGEVRIILEAKCKECIWASIMEIESFDLLKFSSIGADDFGLYEYHIKGVAKKLSEEDMMIVLGLNQIKKEE